MESGTLVTSYLTSEQQEIYETLERSKARAEAQRKQLRASFGKVLTVVEQNELALQDRKIQEIQTRMGQMVLHGAAYQRSRCKQQIGDAKAKKALFNVEYENSYRPPESKTKLVMQLCWLSGE